MKKIQSTFKSITESIKSQKHSVQNDPFDIRHFERIRDKNPRILETYEEGVDSYPQFEELQHCLLYTSPSPRDLSTSRMPSSA